jgi:hypothetical protein
MRSMAVALLPLAVGCAPPELCAAGRTPAIAPAAAPIAHAHNDYEHPRPLEDALAAGFGSVEADVWLKDGDVQVSHDGLSFAGTLGDLYLAPLSRRLADRDSVHDDGRVFTLWIDIKDAAVGEALTALLAAQAFLTRFDDDGVSAEGPVKVILTGDDAEKTRLVDATASPRPFARDDNALSLDDAPDGRVVAAALSFSGYVGGWDGAGAPPEGLSRQCGCVVERAHTLGRTVRLFGGPDSADSWRFQIAHGVDFVNADDLAGLAAVLADLP